MCLTATDARARAVKCSYLIHDKPRTSLSTSVAAGLELRYLARSTVRSSFPRVRR